MLTGNQENHNAAAPHLRVDIVLLVQARPSDCLAELPDVQYTQPMKTLTVRLPEPLLADIEAESRGRKISKSDVVRERLELAPRKRRRTTSLNAIADLIGSVDDLPTDLAARKKQYLQETGYGQKHRR